MKKFILFFIFLIVASLSFSSDATVEKEIIAKYKSLKISSLTVDAYSKGIDATLTSTKGISYNTFKKLGKDLAEKIRKDRDITG
ncbi:MAG: hypothetical protein ACRCRV_05260, partial [Cetobacterium sp.]